MQSRVQIFSILISDFLLPLKPSSFSKASRTEDLLAHKIKPSAKILLTIVRNALRCHQSEKHRKIRLSNPNIQKMVVTVPYAMDLLTAVGFVYAEFDGEKYFMFSENEHNVVSANLFCSTMEEELNSMDPPSFAIGTHSFPETKKTKSVEKNSIPDQDTFLLEKERKERTMRMKEEKRAKIVEKESTIQRWAEDQELRMERKKRETDCKKKRDDEANIRRLHESPSAGTSASLSEDPKSLESLRVKAAGTWRSKQHNSMSNGASEVKHATSNSNDPVVNKTSDDSKGMPMDVEDVQDLKPAASPEEEILPQLSDLLTSSEIDMQPSWEESLEKISRCGPASGIRETSVLNKDSRPAYSSSTQTCLKRLFVEFEELKTSLPSNELCSAWLRYDEETPQYIRALLTAPLPGPSPYSGGIFTFDILIPDDYPNVSPKVQIVTTGRGKVRFGPNLYACGKVCLSLLGTWEGPKWNPKRSSLFQVLISIQSLMLGVEHPYFLEPGHGGWEDKVKEGDFASIGETLSGDTVKEDLALPAHAWIYEDKIRVGTVRYAMLEPLQMVCREKNIVKPSLAHLVPFENIIKLHFSHNGAKALGSVADWINSSRPSTVGSNGQQSISIPPSKRRQVSSQPYPTEFVSSLNDLFHQFEKCLKKLSGMKSLSVSLNGAVYAITPSTDNANSSNANKKRKEVDILRLRMGEAAEKDNFILAGQLQNAIQTLELLDQRVANLKAKIKEAASEGDFIRAGELQANLKSLQNKSANSASSCLLPSVQIDTEDEQMQSVENPSSDDDDGYNDGFDDGPDEDYDESSNYMQDYMPNIWGAGQRLDEATSTTQPLKKLASKTNVQAKISVPRQPVKVSCRLRIRFPNSSVVEEFDFSEKLAVVYKVVKSHMPSEATQRDKTAPKIVQVRGVLNALGNQMVDVSGGAFASPISEFGFTLLSVRPKREYSLEINGMTSLKDLGLAPCTTLSVMMCSSRGQVKRGALESKIAGAQGDAMDLEDLGYEALQELGEKIGVAEPGDGAWKGIDETTLENISTLMSSKDYLAQKTTGEEDYKCCICLGKFDPMERDPQLRVLKYCSHTFHSACLQTWLLTKTSCPVCKHSLNQK